MKKPTFKQVLVFLKYTSGTIGVSAVIADFKWIGVTCLVIGAMSDGALKSFFEG